MTYRVYIFKRKLENIFIFPFIVVGKILARLRSPQKHYTKYFFFPFYHTGGAEKVHSLIVQCTADSNSIIFFTRKSADVTFLKDFLSSNAAVKDISKYTDNKWIFFMNLVYRGYISELINRSSRNPIVFNGQSNFGYKISPWIESSIKQVELIHALNTFSLIRIPFLSFYSRSITISREIIDKHRLFYKKIKVPDKVFSKFRFIENKIELPPKHYRKDWTMPLKVLFVGRNSIEKRIGLVAAIAKRFENVPEKIQFHFAGDVQAEVSNDVHALSVFHGNVTDRQVLNSVYRECHIVLIPSSTESGPFTLMEGMSQGCYIMSTKVGYVPLHIRHKENGFMFSDTFDENKILDEAFNFLQKAIADISLIKNGYEQRIDYAYEHFGMETFERNYRHLFDELTKA